LKVRRSQQIGFSSFSSLDREYYQKSNGDNIKYWSMTVYDVATRCIINRSSRIDLLVNEDCSVDLYIGPDLPEATRTRTESKKSKL